MNRVGEFKCHYNYRFLQLGFKAGIFTYYSHLKL